jgi:hypothetical protein
MLSVFRVPAAERGHAPVHSSIDVAEVSFSRTTVGGSRNSASPGSCTATRSCGRTDSKEGERKRVSELTSRRARGRRVGTMQNGAARPITVTGRRTSRAVVRL